MLDSFFKFFSSLKLTVILLGIAMVLVFVGTIAQVQEGLYLAQARYFKSFLIFWSPEGSALKIPVFPGGYLVGTMLLINLVAAHIKRFQFTRKKSGIFLTHVGVVMLLLGQLLTDVLSTESALRFAEGESKNYSEDFHANELAFIDGSDPDQDRVVAIPEQLLKQKGEVRHEKLPFTVQVLEYWPNSDLFRSPTNGTVEVRATQGIGMGLHLLPRPVATSTEQRSLPSALIRLTAGGKELGTWLVSSLFSKKQSVAVEGKSFDLALRFKRHYTPYSLTLLDAKNEYYVGTEVPKLFSSRIKINNPVTKEDRESLIEMNSPLRYEGLTYYQYQMGPGQEGIGQSSTLQVVRNPGWLTPYLACGIVAAGLVIQFMIHLVGFATRRRNTA